MNKTQIVIIVILLIIILLSVAYSRTKKNIYLSAGKINEFFTRFTKDPAILNPNDHPWSQAFRDNWQTIRDEYVGYTGVIPVHNQINAVVSSIDRGNKWKTLYLRAYGKDTTIAKYFPRTMRLINRSPCTLAFLV